MKKGYKLAGNIMKHGLDGRLDIFTSIAYILFYNGYVNEDEEKDYLVNLIRGLKKCKEKGINFSPSKCKNILNFSTSEDNKIRFADKEFEEWGTELHFLYMILVGMFGDWGTSIRSGWIEDIDECIEFVEALRANAL